MDDGNNIELSNAIATGTPDSRSGTGTYGDIENEIRQALNLDLLSLRVGVVQNLLENVISSTTPNPFVGTSVSLGEYLHNTTLIIGKYLGNDIYFEGSIQLQEQSPLDRLVDDQIGLRVLPEIRIEWNMPIFTLSWSWNIFEHPETLSVTDHRITFSRDFSPTN